jgi:hypothetical protein
MFEPGTRWSFMPSALALVTPPEEDIGCEGAEWISRRLKPGMTVLAKASSNLSDRVESVESCSCEKREAGI